MPQWEALEVVTLGQVVEKGRTQVAGAGFDRWGRRRAPEFGFASRHHLPPSHFPTRPGTTARATGSGGGVFAFSQGRALQTLRGRSPAPLRLVCCRLNFTHLPAV